MRAAGVQDSPSYLVDLPARHTVERQVRETHLEMCSAVISARLRMRLAAKLRRRCSCPTFLAFCDSLLAAAASAQAARHTLETPRTFNSRVQHLLQDKTVEPWVFEGSEQSVSLQEQQDGRMHPG